MATKLKKEFVVVEVDKDSNVKASFGKFVDRKSAVRVAQDYAKANTKMHYFVAELKEYYIGRAPAVANIAVRQYNRYEEDDFVTISAPPKRDVEM